MSRRTAIVFITWQTLSVIGAVSSPFVHSEPGRWLWIVGYVGLLPGNLLAALVVEKTLWRSSVSLAQLSFVMFVLAVALNWVLWRAVARAARGIAPVPPANG